MNRRSKRESTAELDRLMAGVVNVRSYTAEAVPPEVLARLLRSFSLGPSLANTQPWEVVRVVRPDRRAAVVASTLDAFGRPGSHGSQAWVAEAPELLVVAVELRRAEARLGPSGRAIARAHAFAALQNLRLMARAEGLATACVVEFDPAHLARALGLPWYLQPVVILTVGRPREQVEVPVRLKVGDLLHEDGWVPADSAVSTAESPRLAASGPLACAEELSGACGRLPERHSVRRFRADPVPAEVVRTALADACLAPSSGNMQPWEFIVVEEVEQRSALVQATFTGYEQVSGQPQSWLRSAPLIVAVCANVKRTRARYGPEGDVLAPLDVAAAAENFLLSLAAQGLGSCWVGGFRADEVGRILNLPEHVRPVGLFPVGYPDSEPTPKPRLSLELVTHRDEFDRRYFAASDQSSGE